MNYHAGTEIAANFKVVYSIESGGGAWGEHPWQEPDDGNTLSVWIANEDDGRAEGFWR